MTSERDIQASILLALGQEHAICRAWRSNCGKARPLSSPEVVVTYGVPGQADISGILLGGRRLELEVKTDIGRQSAEQKRFEAMIRAMGGEYILARSVEEAVERVRAAAAGRVA